MVQVELKEVRPEGWAALASVELSRVPCVGEHVKVQEAVWEVVAVVHVGLSADVLVRWRMVEDLTSDVKRRAKEG